MRKYLLLAVLAIGLVAPAARASGLKGGARRADTSRVFHPGGRPLVHMTQNEEIVMTPLQENERLEYEALMARGRDAELSSHISWVLCGVASTVLLAWGVAGRSATMMLPVILAAGYGYYSMLRGRQQVRLIAGYIEEFFESHENGARWFTWLGHLRLVPGLSPSSDWLMTCLSISLVALATLFAWVFAGAHENGGLVPGLMTGLSVAFAFHAISETARLHRTNFAAFWRQVNTAHQESSRPALRAVAGGRPTSDWRSSSGSTPQSGLGAS